MTEQSELLAASHSLSTEVQALRQQLTITDKALQDQKESLRRQRIWTRVTLGLIGVVVVALVFTFSLYRAVKASVADNKASQVTNCQNSNESRVAAQKLWDFVVDLSEVGKQSGEVLYLERVRGWVHTIYQQHDCSQLGKKYPLPAPPPIPKVSR